MTKQKIKKKRIKDKKIERIDLLFTMSVLSDINIRNLIIENGGMIKGQKRKSRTIIKGFNSNNKSTIRSSFKSIR